MLTTVTVITVSYCLLNPFVSASYIVTFSYCQTYCILCVCFHIKTFSIYDIMLCIACDCDCHPLPVLVCPKNLMYHHSKH